MFKKKIELIKPIIYQEGYNGIEASQFGIDNRLYRSLDRIFEQFFVYEKKELFLVGGCVRDMLMGRAPKDYDLTTNATPEEVKAICEKLKLKTFDSGIKHGTLTIIDEFYGQSYEITTYRTESKYTDHRHPDKVEFVASLEEDLKRRDFTINSFAYNLLTNEVLALDESYFKDLEFGIIRAVGDPAERYEEDALRMLRALRFSAQLNFSVEKYTYLAIKMCAPLLTNISKERIRDELTKILLSDNPQTIELFVVSGLEKYAFNDKTPFGDMIACEHQNPWHYTDVFHHTMDVVKRMPKTFELRWAALLHDVGKPRAKKPRPQGPADHFVYYDHPIISAEIADELMEILKFSNEQSDIIHKFVYHHDAELADCRNASFKAVVAEIGIDHFLDFIKLKFADAMAHRLSRDTKYAIDAVDKIKSRFEKIVAEDQALTTKDLDIDGYALMNLGLVGKQIGDCLNYLLEAVLEDSTLNTNETLKRLASGFVENLKNN